MAMNDTQYTINAVCRSLEFYVDPQSTEVMEFGTKQYPYRYFKYASSEIINQFSHKDVEITVYQKEGTDVYIKEGDTFFLNITKVAVKSYSDSVDSPDYVIIIPTSFEQPSDSKKAAFNILSHTNSNVNQAIAKGSFTSTELGLIFTTPSAFVLVRSGFSIEKAKVLREIGSIQQEVNFVFPIYLQHLFVSIDDCLFNTTGNILWTQDPTGLIVNNVEIEVYFPTR